MEFSPLLAFTFTGSSTARHQLKLEQNCRQLGKAGSGAAGISDKDPPQTFLLHGEVCRLSLAEAALPVVTAAVVKMVIKLMAVFYTSKTSVLLPLEDVVLCLR